ncbi:MAG: type I restriction enzyme HsdR N-terminal domain-containing protein [Cytophagales bacterium]|nr:type I restriction enzyme HsdR N-terminal domain-containing protein [Cytophagales bacterium]
MDEYKYPKGLIKIESGLRNTDHTLLNKRDLTGQADYKKERLPPRNRGRHRLKEVSPAYWADRRGKRCDIIVYDGSGQPYMVVECKAPSVKITQKTFDQIARYNYSLKATYLIVTNGLLHFCCRIDHRERKYEYLDYIPKHN